MNSIQRTLALSLVAAWVSTAGAGDDETARLSALLDAFLAGASINDIGAHQRFWADDLVYTSSAGSRFGKADIIDGIRAAEAESADAEAAVYSAEDVDIRVYGVAAVVAFRLVGTSAGTVQQYYNTGTFLKRDGEWRAVAWQATRIPGQAVTDH